MKNTRVLVIVALAVLFGSAAGYSALRYLNNRPAVVQMSAGGETASVVLAARDLDLGLFAKPGYESNTVTAITFDATVRSTGVIRRLREEYDIIVGSSKAPGVEMIRIGHMGHVSEEELDQVFDALGEILGR